MNPNEDQNLNQPKESGVQPADASQPPQPEAPQPQPSVPPTFTGQPAQSPQWQDMPPQAPPPLQPPTSFQPNDFQPEKRHNSWYVIAPLIAVFVIGLGSGSFYLFNSKKDPGNYTEKDVPKKIVSNLLSKIFLRGK